MKRSTLLNCSAIVIALGAGLALTGCNQAPSASQVAPPQDALPLTTASAPPIVDAPPANALPAAPRPRIARVSDPRDSYGYADQAYEMGYAFGDAPPDYTFDYDGTRPWVWRSENNAEQVVEPVDGGERYYYYQPGQDYPYLIRDVDYSYGFDNGALVVIYDRHGRVMPPDFIESRADYAGRYLYRGRDLYDASLHRQHEAVAAANWQARRDLVIGAVALWASFQSQQPDWRAYHEQHEAQEAAQWDPVRYRREAYAAQTYQAMNDPVAAQRALQAAQQVQANAQARGQPIPGAQRPGFMGQLFGKPNNSPAQQAQSPQVQAPAAGQGFAPPNGAASPAHPPYSPSIAGPNQQAQAGAPIGATHVQAEAHAQDQAQAQAQNQAQLRKQQEAAARSQADAARVASADQARLQAQAQAHQQQEAAVRAQADAARVAATDRVRLQAQAQAHQQQEAAARAQADAANRAAAAKAKQAQVARAVAEKPAPPKEPKEKTEREHSERAPGTPSN